MKFLIILFEAILLAGAMLGAVLLLFMAILLVIGCIDAMRRRGL